MSDSERTGIAIFVSHSSADADLALTLVTLLQASLYLKEEQIRCTSVPGYQIKSGAKTSEVLKAEALQAQAFIGLITPKSLASSYVLFELGARWGANRTIIPLRAGVTPDTLPALLQDTHSPNANVAQLNQLISDIASDLGITKINAAATIRYAEQMEREATVKYETSATAPHRRLWKWSLFMGVFTLLIGAFIYGVLSPRLKPNPSSVLSFASGDSTPKGVMIVIPSTSRAIDYYLTNVCKNSTFRGLKLCKPASSHQEDPTTPLHATGYILPYFGQFLSAVASHNIANHKENKWLWLAVSWPADDRNEMQRADGYDLIVIGGPVRSGYFYEVLRRLKVDIPLDFSDPVYESLFCQEHYGSDFNNGIMVGDDLAVFGDSKRQKAYETAVGRSCSNGHRGDQAYYYPSVTADDNDDNVWRKLCDPQWQPPGRTHRENGTGRLECVQTGKASDATKDDDVQYSKDYCLIVVGNNPYDSIDSKRKLIMVAGTHALGTEGGLQYVQDMQDENQLLREVQVQPAPGHQNGLRYVFGILEVKSDRRGGVMKPHPVFAKELFPREK